MPPIRRRSRCKLVSWTRPLFTAAAPPGSILTSGFPLYSVSRYLTVTPSLASHPSRKRAASSSKLKKSETSCPRCANMPARWKLTQLSQRRLTVSILEVETPHCQPGGWVREGVKRTCRDMCRIAATYNTSHRKQAQSVAWEGSNRTGNAAAAGDRHHCCNLCGRQTRHLSADAALGRERRMHTHTRNGDTGAGDGRLVQGAAQDRAMYGRDVHLQSSRACRQQPTPQGSSKAVHGCNGVGVSVTRRHDDCQ